MPAGIGCVQPSYRVGCLLDDRISRLESAVEQLQATVLSLAQRVKAVEDGSAVAIGTAPRIAVPAAALAAPGALPPRAVVRDPYDPIAILSLVGRLLLVLAGGFFLRAMTDAGTIAVPVGIALAFAYATVWLFMSDRAGKRGQVPNAVLHALAAALIAFPLVVEATTRFKVLSGASSALIVAALSAGLLFVAWHRHIRAASWITVVGALPTSVAILVQTGVVAPFALYLVGLGIATLWLSYAVDWWGSRWPAALAADVAVAGVTLRAFAPERHDTPQIALMLLLLLLLGYFGSVAVRTLVRGREVSRFELVQSTAALLVGLGGAVLMARALEGVPDAVGVAALFVGGACYGAAVAVVGRRGGSALNFHFYATLALVLVVAGLGLAAGGAWLGAAFALLGVLCAGLWSRTGRLFLLLHGVVYIVAAGVVSGALAYGLRSLVGGVEGPWAVPNAGMLVALLGSALAAGLAASRRLAKGDELAAGARFSLTIAFVWLLGGSAIGFLAPLVGGWTARSVDAGLLATVGTGVLSVATLALAWMGRYDRFREWGWLMYPLLVGTGLKLVALDFKHSRPATLFIAMALFGAALIIAPRLRRRVEKGVGATSEP